MFSPLSLNNKLSVVERVEELLENGCGGNTSLELEKLNEQKNELLAAKAKIEQLLIKINAREEVIKSQAAPKEITTELPIQLSPKVPEVAHTILRVNTHQTIESKDGGGVRRHYSISLISKSGEIVEVAKGPIDISKYGSIEKVMIFDGKSSVMLDDDIPLVGRLMKYFSTDLGVLRKEIKSASNACSDFDKFDCNRFCYYLKHNKEGDFKPHWKSRRSVNFRNEAKHDSNQVYSIEALTADLGKNGDYRAEDMSLHYYACLSDNVFVSKFGESGVLFNSYQQILDAYFPEKFIKGTFSREI